MAEQEGLPYAVAASRALRTGGDEGLQCRRRGVADAFHFADCPGAGGYFPRKVTNTDPNVEGILGFPTVGTPEAGDLMYDEISR
jgi:hypothetical protein